jgi:hypothetical protein
MAIIIQPKDELLDIVDPKLFKEAEKAMKLSFQALQTVIDNHLQKLAEKDDLGAINDFIDLHQSYIHQIDMLLNQHTRHREHYKNAKWLYDFFIKRALVFQYKPTKKEVFAIMRKRLAQFLATKKYDPAFNGKNQTAQARKALEYLKEQYPDADYYPSVDVIRKDWFEKDWLRRAE